MPQSYKVICKQCGKSEIIPIDKDNNVYWGRVKSIISARYRLDMQWGFQCLCGNNDLLTRQEDKVITDKQNPDVRDIDKVLKTLIPDKPKFEMELI